MKVKVWEAKFLQDINFKLVVCIFYDIFDPEYNTDTLKVEIIYSL